jgi:hypothetical protein
MPMHTLGNWCVLVVAGTIRFGSTAREGRRALPHGRHAGGRLAAVGAGGHGGAP